MDTELQQEWGAQQGFTIRYPFFDGDVVRLALAIAPENRLPGGQFKRLARSALADLLPPAILHRRVVTVFTASQLEHCARYFSSAAEVVEGGDWPSAPYVDRDEARVLLTAFGVTSPPTGPASGFWSGASPP